MRYMVMTGDSDISLAKAVEHWIEDGWKPQGGVCISVEQMPDAHREYAQALVKEEPTQQVVINVAQGLDAKQIEKAVYSALRSVTE